MNSLVWVLVLGGIWDCCKVAPEPKSQPVWAACEVVAQQDQAPEIKPEPRATKPPVPHKPDPPKRRWFRR